MLLHRRHRSSRSFLVSFTSTLFHQVEGFPVLVKKTATKIPRVVSSLPPLPILSDASWSDDTAVSSLATRSSSDVVHDKVFIPTIATMGVLVIICIYCCYHLIVNRETVHTRGGPNEPPISSSQQAVGQQENGNKPLSRGLSKATRVSAPSTSASIPGSPSVASNNMLDLLQRRREEQHLRELQQDPYQQYISSNQGHPQQPYQHTPHPSMPGSVMQGVQPQPPLSAHVPIAQSLSMNTNPSRERHRTPEQNLQPPVPQLRVSHAPSAQTSSTRVTSDILSYMTPPEDRKRPLPTNSSQPQNQDYFIPQHPSANGTGSSTPRTITHSVPANSNPASRHPSTTDSAPAAYARRYGSQPPGYAATETRNNDQENVTAPNSERQRNQS